MPTVSGHSPARLAAQILQQPERAPTIAHTAPEFPELLARVTEALDAQPQRTAEVVAGYLSRLRAGDAQAAYHFSAVLMNRPGTRTAQGIMAVTAKDVYVHVLPDMLDLSRRMADEPDAESVASVPLMIAVEQVAGALRGARATAPDASMAADLARAEAHTASRRDLDAARAQGRRWLEYAESFVASQAVGRDEATRPPRSV